MRKSQHKQVNISLRIAIVMAFLLCCFVVVVVRAFSIQVKGAEFYQSQGEKRHVREVEIPVSRGSIYDRNGEPLALSTAMVSVGIVPGQLLDQFSKVEQLAEVLELNADELKNIITSRKDRQFLFIKRRVTPMLADQVKALNMKGVEFRTEFKRFYPTGEILANVVGFTDVEDVGQEGLERTYDNWLTGTSGKKTVVKDLLGQVIADIDVDELKAAKPGKDLHLSLDRRLQYAAYLELKKAVYKHRATSGSAVVLDVKTGEILAMVNQPSFNPNGSKENTDGLRNRSVTDIYEPGSVMKPFAVVAALESAEYNADSIIDTSPGVYEVDGFPIRDFRDYGELNIVGILVKSSNVGMAKLVLDLGKDHLWDVYHRFGFGQSSGSGFMGESAGYLMHHERWRTADHAALSRGYGLSVTTLQLASAYSVFANKGRYRAPTFIKGNVNEDKAIIDPMIASQLTDMLSHVVNDVEGHKAFIPNYTVAGKTGTARIAEKGGYSDNYMSSFVGFSPVSSPRLVVAVNINNPQGEDYYGGLVAAPVFTEIMKTGLRLLNVPADQVARTLVDNNTDSQVLGVDDAE